VGQLPVEVVPIYPEISIRYACGDPGLMVRLTRFAGVASRGSKGALQYTIEMPPPVKAVVPEGH